MPKDLPATIPARLDRQVATVGTQATTARPAALARPAAIASRTNQLRPERIRSSSTRRRHTRKGGEKQGLTWFARQLVSGKVEEISRKTLRVPLAGHADGPRRCRARSQSGERQRAPPNDVVSVRRTLQRCLQSGPIAGSLVTRRWSLHHQSPQRGSHGGFRGVIEHRHPVGDRRPLPVGSGSGLRRRPHRAATLPASP
jgi:hypothetical protein